MAKNRKSDPKYYFTKRKITPMQLKHDPTELYRYRSGSELYEEPSDDDFGLSCKKSVPALICDVFPIIKETKCGYWIDALEWKNGGYNTRRRFVLKDSRQSFASPIRYEALRSYIYRKQKQLSYIEADLEKAKGGLLAARRLMESMQENKII